MTVESRPVYMYMYFPSCSSHMLDGFCVKYRLEHGKWAALSNSGLHITVTFVSSVYLFRMQNIPVKNNEVKPVKRILSLTNHLS